MSVCVRNRVAIVDRTQFAAAMHTEHVPCTASMPPPHCAMIRDTHGDRTDVQAWCWGLDVRGGLGRGMIPVGSELLTDLIVPTPQRVATTLRFRRIAVGALMSTCAVSLAEEHAWCWGNNTSGVLGIGSRRRISSVLPFSSTVSPALVRTGATGSSF